MNWKNTAENLGIVIVSALLGAGIGYFASTYSNKQSIELFTPTLLEAIKKETVKNEIDNKISIGKIKKSDSINIVLSPQNNQEPINNIAKSNCVDISGLSDSRKRRVYRWLKK
ncbi:hypothetical protein [Tenacibaculum sp. nBUS_03]|uniref:hypothetical protein n=1 Tax=Tenacibaculum sp. nBUS_03 TaxID=3395320 RepID=UPI003EBE6111